MSEQGKQHRSTSTDRLEMEAKLQELLRMRTTIEEQEAELQEVKADLTSVQNNAQEADDQVAALEGELSQARMHAELEKLREVDSLH